jgi:uncharacterized protein YeeX (DUF496 family)
MVMNMTDHLYLLKERKQEQKNEEQRELQEYENKIRKNLKNYNFTFNNTSTYNVVMINFIT